MVGIVVVSHSDTLAEGVVRLAREMGGEELALEPAGGMDEPGVLGTDPERVRAAIERAMSDDGVLVLMDLGSALMSAEFAVELLGESSGRVLLSEAPLVEGAVAAAVAARGGSTLEEVAAEARGALAMKASQLGIPEADAASAGQDSRDAQGEAGATAADARASLQVRNEIGLHARPAARLVEIARGFDAEVRVAKGPDGRSVSATSLTNVVALGARFGDTLLLSAAGRQAREAIEALQALADKGFGDGLADQAPVRSRAGPGSVAAAGSVTAPRTGAGHRAAARAERPAPAPGQVLTGVPASLGLAVGPAHRLHGAPEPPPARAAETPELERTRLEQAIAAARETIARDRETVAGRAGRAEAEIFDAHLALLDDEAMLDPAGASIDAGAPAEQAWHDAAAAVAARYRALDQPLLRERAVDVLDVGRRVVDALTGRADDGPTLAGIVIAGELTPAAAAGLDPAIVLGIATAHGTATAHAAILARALGLPAVVGLGDVVLGIEDGTMLLLDGEAGTLLLDPPPDTVHEAERRRRRADQRHAAARTRAHEPGGTRDGARIEVYANLGSAAGGGPSG